MDMELLLFISHHWFVLTNELYLLDGCYCMQSLLAELSPYILCQSGNGWTCVLSQIIPVPVPAQDKSQRPLSSTSTAGLQTSSPSDGKKPIWYLFDHAFLFTFKKSRISKSFSTIPKLTSNIEFKFTSNNLKSAVFGAKYMDPSLKAESISPLSTWTKKLSSNIQLLAISLPVMISRSTLALSIFKALKNFKM